MTADTGNHIAKKIHDNVMDFLMFSERPIDASGGFRLPAELELRL
ncbi:MAG: hypothetical protein ACI97A_002559 [Planctomycetota bacterium]|jgi:hypothetical protein